MRKFILNPILFLVRTAITYLLVMTILTPLLLVTHYGLIFQSKKNIDPVFLPFYHSFLEEAKSRGFSLSHLNISINFNPTLENKKQSLAIKNQKELGYCELHFTKDPVINIDPVAWSQMTTTQREMTVYHELGHCLLLKGHTSTKTHDHRHLSLMNPLSFPDQEYLSNKDHYLDELFKYRPYHLRDYLITFVMEPAQEKITYFWDKRIKP